MSILKQAILYSYRPRKDKSLSLTFITQEVTADEVADIHSQQDTFGVLYFKEGESISDAEQQMIDNFKIKTASGKSHSQRLRSVLYVAYGQSNNEEGLTFEEFYAQRMEKIIQFYLDKLD